MTTETQIGTIQIRRDTAANLASLNPVLASGEWCYDETNKIVKIGDGVTAWLSLPVFAGGSGSGTTTPNTITVTSPGQHSATDGVAFSLALAAADTSGGTTFTWTAIGLPTGLSINASTGLISGTPSNSDAAGAVTVTVAATDPSGATGSAVFQIVLAAAVVTGNTVTVANPGAHTGTAGASITAISPTATDTAGGQTLTWTATGLPAGLAISSTTGQITGTPTTAGNYTVTVTAKDTTQASGSASFAITVAAAPTSNNTVTVTNPGAKSGVVGTAFALAMVASDSGTGQTLTWSATGLPAGLSINAATGQISGTPTAAAVSQVTVTATDTTNASNSVGFQITVVAAGVTVAASSPPLFIRGYGGTSFQLTATDSDTTITSFNWTATGLPAGLVCSSSGVISGTPTTVGTGQITVTATDSHGTSGSRQISITVAATNPTFAAIPTQSAVTGSAFSYQLAATEDANGQGIGATFTYAAAGLPAGLACSAGGLISGTPTATGAVTVGVTATDSTGSSVSTTFQLSVTAPLANFALHTSSRRFMANIGGGNAAISVGTGATNPSPAVAAADLILALGYDLNTDTDFASTLSVPSGYTLLLNAADPNVDADLLAVVKASAAGGENIAFPSSADPSAAWGVGLMLAFAKATGVRPASVSANLSRNSFTAPAITPGAATDYLVSVLFAEIANPTASTATPPTGMTLIDKVASGTSVQGVLLAIAGQQLTSTAATGNSAWALSGVGSASGVSVLNLLVTHN